MMWRSVLLVAMPVLIAAACGDPEPGELRGYTKSPLERPGLLIRSDEGDPMRELGAPLLPETRELDLHEDGAAQPN